MCGPGNGRTIGDAGGKQKFDLTLPKRGEAPTTWLVEADQRERRSDCVRSRSGLTRTVAPNCAITSARARSMRSCVVGDCSGCELGVDVAVRTVWIIEWSLQSIPATTLGASPRLGSMYLDILRASIQPTCCWIARGE